MTTDEAFKKACKLFWTFYEATGKETFVIRGDVLKDDGLDNSTFWTLVCPKLVKDGILDKIPRINHEKVPTLQNKELGLNMYKTYRAFLFSINKNKLLEALNRTESFLNIEDSKIDICINMAKGIYLAHNIKISYPISGRRLNIIKKLIDQDIIAISELRDLTGWDNSDVSRTISKINKTFRNKLKVKDNLIDHIDTGGYTFNRKKFNIDFDF